MLLLTDSVTALKGVGKTRADQLNCLGIQTIGDLIAHFPRQYEDRTKISDVRDLVIGKPACFEAMVVSTPRTGYVRSGLNTTRCTVADSSAQVRVTWFNQPWMGKNLVPGVTYCFYGTLSGDERTRQIVNPIVEPLDAPPNITRCIIPIYALTKGLSSKVLQKLIFQALEQIELPEYLPEQVNEALMARRPAYIEAHRPTTPVLLKEARRRLAFEEFFLYAMGLVQLRQERKRKSDYPCPKQIPQFFYDQLTFPLTKAQRRCLEEISGDLSSGRPMNRLLQGDVGSGKTVVAMGAILQVVENGMQAALMVPTELLATQHYQSISALFEPMGIRCALLTGSITGRERRSLLNCVASGLVQVLIGTHALFTDTTEFHRLGLVVIDEQHRFGVRQRAALAAKGIAPHMLVLSATPIPRTLALILYGDLAVSVINELPPGRKPVDTFLVGSSYHARLHGFIRKQTAAGHQVYVVCPAVEENEDMGLTSAQSMYAQLQQVFPDLSIGLVHGKLNGDIKDHAMQAFAKHETDILVATTVIEVGVDVRNATLMIIENADRFGLSQLHQLRGRVGRNAEQSYCVLVSDNTNPDTRRRLKALCETNDGFAISQQDLDLRGPGDFFGHRQSGLPMFKHVSLAENLTVLREAQLAAERFMATSPDPQDPQYEDLFMRVQQLFSEMGDTMN